MSAADAQRLVDDGDGTRSRGFLGEGDDLLAQQVGEPADHRVPAWWTQIDRRAILDDRGCVRPAARVPALCALRLW